VLQFKSLIQDIPLVTTFKSDLRFDKQKRRTWQLLKLMHHCISMLSMMVFFKSSVSTLHTLTKSLTTTFILQINHVQLWHGYRASYVYWENYR